MQNMINTQELLDLYNLANNKTLLSYTGIFDGQILSVIAENIESNLAQNPNASRKVFKIFLELAQNISFYSTEKQTNSKGKVNGMGILILQEFEDHYSCSTGNMGNTEMLKEVIKKCETINILERDDLREYKRKLRSLPASAKGGGNIGLVQVALTSGNPLAYKIIPITKTDSFYIVNTKINK